MDHLVKPQCRLCLAPSPEQYDSIADSGMRCKLDIVFKFELPLDDRLPYVICDECSTKVDEFCFFHETVRTNQLQLKTATMTNTGILMLDEIKAEPADVEETEEIDIKEPIITADVAMDYEAKEDDLLSTTETYLAFVEPIQNKNGHDSTITTDLAIQTQYVWPRSISERDRIIAEFFNGIKCSICSEKFDTFSRLKSHNKKVHTQKGSITCCKRKFFERTRIFHHVISHLDSKYNYCELCDKNFRGKDGLKVHNMQCHTNPEEHPFKCKICNKTFLKKSFLSSHRNTHIRPTCSVCGRTMSNIYSLKDHMRKKHSEQPRDPTTTNRRNS